MPQITVEYTNNIIDEIDFPQLLAKVHKIIREVTGASMASLKSRAIKLDNFYIADGEADNAFVHLQLYMIEGRSIEMKQELGEKVLVCLEEAFPKSKAELELQITVKIGDINKDTYFKYPKGSLTPQK